MIADFNLEVSALGPRFDGTGVSRRARPMIEVTVGAERARRMTSAATRPVEPTITSFMVLIEENRLLEALKIIVRAK